MPNHEQFVEGGRGRIEVSTDPCYDGCQTIARS
jgi:hypothetical protein